MRALWPLVWAGCVGEPAPRGPDRCAESWVTWENTARPQLDTWCTPCHAAPLVGAERQGAPPGVDFDTWEGARDWAVRIAARTHDGSMPPAGGPTDEERSLLIEWAACGADGESTAPTADPCLPEVRFEGDGPVDLCAEGYNAVAGDLRIDGAAPGCLCAVGGSLTVEATEVALPLLRSVGGDLTVGPAVEVLRAPDLASVGGDLRVEAAPGLWSLWLDRLDAVGGDYALVALPALSDWRGAMAPRTIGGSIRLQDLDALPEIDAFGRVESLGGDVVISGHDTATRLLGLQKLVAVPGRVELSGNPSMTLIETLPDVVTIGGELVVADHPALVELSGLRFLTGAAGLTLRGAPALRTFSLPALEALDGLTVEATGWTGAAGFPALASVKGELALVANPALKSLDGLSAVQSVDAVVIRDNPALSQAAIETWLAGLEAVGTADVSGNGP